MQVVVEENRPQPTRHAQVPRAVFAVERREGMVGVLQRTPGKAEGGIAGQPTAPRPAEQPSPEKLPRRRAEYFQTGGQLRQAVEAADIVFRPALQAATAAEKCGQAAADETRRGGIEKHADDGARPIKAGKDGVPLGVFQPQHVAVVQGVELFRRRTVVAVVGEVEHALHGKAGGKPEGGEAAAPCVQPPVGRERAVHAFVQQREHRIVAQGKQCGRHGRPPPRRVRGGVEQQQVGGIGGGQQDQVEFSGGNGYGHG